MTSPGYVTELALLKNEISQLKKNITMAVAQVKQAFESLQMPHHNNEQSAMDTDDKESMHSTVSSPMQDGDNTQHLELPDIIRDLKNDIATISHKTQAMIKRCMPQ